MRRSDLWVVRRRPIRGGPRLAAEPGSASTAHPGSAGASPSHEEKRQRAESGEQRSENLFDWRGWLSLAWMVGFGVLYALMILKEKAPGLYARISGHG